ncbi:MAG: retroviral-like aspartic protease family protein [Bacteroidales bacterium]|jgi:hypothetical protein|nr:retroviral-like aspartic protease family protein [Bacteroidales bacterium]
MIKIFILLPLMFFISSVTAQNINFNKGKIKQKNYLQEIPYEKIVGIPIVPVTINGKMYNFILDTGAMLVISDRIYKELNLPILGRIIINSSSGEKKDMKYISLPEISIQEITFINTPGVVFHEESELFECLGIDGIIGSNMLRNSVVQFDEQNKLIIITDNIKKLSLQKSKSQKMKLSSNQSLPFIIVTLQKEENIVDYRALFDSGQSDFYNMSMNNFNEVIVSKIAESEGSFSFGIHGLHKKQKHLLINIPNIIISGATFCDLTVTTTHANYSRIGAKLLKHGKTTLDYKKKRFYFEPFGNTNTIELSEKTWAISSSLQDNKMIVGIIWDKELESKINLGDEILSINGIDIQSMSFCELIIFEIASDDDKRILELRDIYTREIKKVEVKRM